MITFFLHKSHQCLTTNRAEPDGGPARRDEAAGAAGGALGGAAAHREGAHPPQAPLPLQLQHRPRVPQEQEGQ